MIDEKKLYKSLKNVIYHLKKYLFYDENIEILKLNTLNCIYFFKNDFNLEFFDNFDNLLKKIKDIIF